MVNNSRMISRRDAETRREVKADLSANIISMSGMLNSKINYKCIPKSRDFSRCVAASPRDIKVISSAKIQSMYYMLSTDLYNSQKISRKDAETRREVKAGLRANIISMSGMLNSKINYRCIPKSRDFSRCIAASPREKHYSINFFLSRLISVLLLGIVLFAGKNAEAQASLDSLLDNVTENSKTLHTARQLYEAEVIGARTGNSPANPEVEYAYLWGTPESIGNRVDFVITQSFDFPTAYSSRSKLSKINQDQAGLKLKLAQQDLMARTRKLWVNAVFINQKMIVLRKRLNNTMLIADAVQRLYEEGEANQMDLNQAILKVRSLTNELSRLSADKIANDAEISRLNGGTQFIVNDSVFPMHTYILLDSLIDMYYTGPRNLAFQGEIVRREQQKDVVFNQKLPKLKAGYYQETILGLKQAGIRAGITIPLWENAHAVKSAKAGILYAQSDAARNWELQRLTLQRMYSEYQILISQVEEMEKLLLTVNSDDLLLKALNSGEISLTQYYYESDFFFQNQLDFIELNRDLHFVEIDLMRVNY